MPFRRFSEETLEDLGAQRSSRATQDDDVDASSDNADEACKFDPKGAVSTLPIEERLKNTLSTKMAIDNLTKIQVQSFNTMISTRIDALIKAETGSGKTLSYALPLVERLLRLRKQGRRLERSDGTRVVVLVPSRELAVQVERVFLVRGRSITGGTARSKEKARLRSGLPVVIGTPGRVLDHLQSTSSFDVSHVRDVVLDEADRLLGSGTLLEAVRRVRSIIATRAASIRTIFVSATITPDLAAAEGVRYASLITASGARSVLETPDTVASGEDGAGTAGVEDGAGGGGGAVLEEESPAMRGALARRAARAAQAAAAAAPQDDGAVAAASSSDAPGTGDSAPCDSKMPSCLRHHVTVVPVKTRLVALTALVRAMVGVWGGKGGDGNRTRAPPLSVQAVEAGITCGRVLVMVSTADESEFLARLWSTSTFHPTGVPVLPDDVDVHSLHGGLSYEQRLGVMRRFAGSSTPGVSGAAARDAPRGVLIATDVAARGLDMPALDWIVNVGVPTGPQVYVHRAGRAGRLGRPAGVLTIVPPEHEAAVESLIASTGSRPPRLLNVPIASVLMRLSDPLGRQKALSDIASGVQFSLEKAIMSARGDRRRDGASPSLYSLAARAFVAEQAAGRATTSLVRSADHSGQLAKAFGLTVTPREAAHEARASVAAERSASSEAPSAEAILKARAPRDRGGAGDIGASVPVRRDLRTDAERVDTARRSAHEQWADAGEWRRERAKRAREEEASRPSTRPPAQMRAARAVASSASEFAR